MRRLRRGELERAAAEAQGDGNRVFAPAASQNQVGRGLLDGVELGGAGPDRGEVGVELLEARGGGGRKNRGLAAAAIAAAVPAAVIVVVVVKKVVAAPAGVRERDRGGPPQTGCAVNVHHGVPSVRRSRPQRAVEDRDGVREPVPQRERVEVDDGDPEVRDPLGRGGPPDLLAVDAEVLEVCALLQLEDVGDAGLGGESRNVLRILRTGPYEDGSVRCSLLSPQ